jgi:RND family efflux transporter MFP subunit
MKLERRAALPILILAVAVGLAAALFLTRPAVVTEEPEVLAPLVRVVVVEPGPVDLVLLAHGTVTPRTESELVAQVAGEVVWVSPALVRGGFFEAGAPLVRLDRRDYDAAVESARAGVARAESQYHRVRKAHERQARLAERSAVSEARIDDAENELRDADAGLREARVRLDQAQRDLSRCELHAAYAGRVRDEDVDIGQFVARGQTLASLYATDYAEVRLPIQDRDLAYLDLPASYLGLPTEAGHESPEVTLRADFMGSEQVWQGRLVRTEGEIDPRSRTVTVVARVDDPYGRASQTPKVPLGIGLFVEAEIRGLHLSDAVVLPRSALRKDGGVFVVDAENRLQVRSVKVLRAERERLVISAGLAKGERVCISPLRGAVPGMSVRVAPAQTVPAEPTP